jgi:hypothetical protein
MDKESIFVLEPACLGEWMLSEYIENENTMVNLDVTYSPTSDLEALSDMLNKILKEDPEKEYDYVIELESAADSINMVFDREWMECRFRCDVRMEAYHYPCSFMVPESFYKKVYTTMLESIYLKLLGDKGGVKGAVKPIPPVKESNQIAHEMRKGRSGLNLKLMNQMINAIEDARDAGFYTIGIILAYNPGVNSRSTLNYFVKAGYDIMINIHEKNYKLIISWEDGERKVGRYYDNTGGL